MIQKSIYTIIITLLLSACTNKITVDNPTVKEVKVTIGNKTISLLGKSTQDITLKSGQYMVSAINSDGDTLMFEHIDINEEGLLNITKSNYYLWTDLFCEEERFNQYKEKLNLKDTVKIENFEFIDIDLVTLNQVFIPKQWDFSISEDFPDKMEVEDDVGFKVVSKLYYLQGLKEAFNYIGDLDLSGLTQEEIDALMKNREN